MLTLMAGECDLLLVPRPNAHGYQGLTQMGQRELAAVGWVTDRMGLFCAAPAEVQIVYSARYFAQKGVKLWTSAGHLWLANLAPNHLTRTDGVVYAELTHGAQYRANRWLDLNRDGVITTDELTRALETISVPRCQARYDLAMAGLAEARLRPYTPNVHPAVVIELRRPEPPDEVA